MRIYGADQLKDVSTRYRTKMNKATANLLAKAKELHDELPEKIYVKAMGFYSHR